MKLKKACVFLAINIFILHNQLIAQLPGMKVYTQLDGFPGTAGYHINQDAKGFIWIGTDNGVACFDGKKFTVIDDKQGLTDKEILVPLPYAGQYVLLAPLLNNISYWKNGKVITRAQNKTLGLISNYTNNLTFIDPLTQKVWIGDSRNYNSLYCITGDTLKKVKISSVPPFSFTSVIDNHIYMLCYNNEQNDVYQFLKYNIQNHTYKPFEFADKQMANYFNNNRVANIRVSNDGKYAIISLRSQRMDVFEVQGNRLYLLSSIFPGLQERHIRIDRNNHLWVALNSGVEYWGHLGDLHTQSQPLVLLEDILLNDIFVDRDNNVWFSTEQKGLCFISARHWASAILTQKLKLPHYPARCIAGVNQHSVIIGHSGKPCFTYSNNGKSTLYTIAGGSPLGVRHILKRGDSILVAANILALYEIKDDRLIFKEILYGSAIKDIALYNNDYLLLADNASLKIIKLNWQNHKPSNSQMLFNGRTTSVAALADKSILVGTPNGLYSKPSLSTPAVKVKNNVLALANITDIEPGRSSAVLIGTNAQGLYNYNYLTGDAYPVELEKNNALGFIRNIYRQNDSIFWLSTNKGVYRINFSPAMVVKAVDNYTFFDGLPSSNTSAVYVQNDTAYIATDAGIGILPLKTRFHASAAPVLWLNRLRFHDSVIFFPLGRVDLTHNQNNIQLSFSAIAYENIGNIKYTYRLNGLSDQWVETESPEVSFSGLSPGVYQLEAYAVNLNGIRAAKPLSISIIIHPAFWQTSWFRGVIFLLIMVLVLFCIYWFVSTEKSKQYKKMQQSRKLAELELEAIKAQINPHFVFNCLNSIQSFSYKNEHELVKEYIRFFAKLIRQTMHYSQETFITLDEEADYLVNYLKLEKIRFKERLEYTLEVDDAMDRHRLLPAMLVQPYVENALKHNINSDNVCRVNINFFGAGDGNLYITIKDNGPGIAFEKQGQENKTLGMRLSGSRVDTYNQLFNLGITLQIQSNTDNNTFEKGTVITLTIPLITHDIAKL